MDDVMGSSVEVEVMMHAERVSRTCALFACVNSSTGEELEFAQ